MSTLHDHERAMMLDLTGEARRVPEIGRASYRWPGDREAEERLGVAEDGPGGPAHQVHAGAGEATQIHRRSAPIIELCKRMAAARVLFDSHVISSAEYSAEIAGAIRHRDAVPAPRVPEVI